jgi:hypothetical protein
MEAAKSCGGMYFSEDRGFDSRSRDGDLRTKDLASKSGPEMQKPGMPGLSHFQFAPAARRRD